MTSISKPAKQATNDIDPFDVWISDVLDKHLPSDLGKIIEEYANYVYIEWDQHYLQRKLNGEVVNKYPYIQEFWTGSLEHISDFYCTECGQHKSSPYDSGSFSIGCRGRPVFGYSLEKPCRDLKYKSCDCHDCYECEEHFCTGHHRQCDKCTGTFLPDITEIWPNFKNI